MIAVGDTVEYGTKVLYNKDVKARIVEAFPLDQKARICTEKEWSGDEGLSKNHKRPLVDYKDLEVIGQDDL